MDGWITLRKGKTGLGRTEAGTHWELLRLVPLHLFSLSCSIHFLFRFRFSYFICIYFTFMSWGAMFRFTSINMHSVSKIQNSVSFFIVFRPMPIIFPSVGLRLSRFIAMTISFLTPQQQTRVQAIYKAVVATSRREQLSGTRARPSS